MKNIYKLVLWKFDGIKIDIKDGKLVYEFEGGLNGMRQTTGNHLINQRLKMSKGDDDSAQKGNNLYFVIENL